MSRGTAVRLSFTFSSCSTRRRTLTTFVRDAGHAQFVTLRTEAVTYIPEDIEPAKAAPLLCASSSHPRVRAAVVAAKS